MPVPHTQGTYIWGFGSLHMCGRVLLLLVAGGGCDMLAPSVPSWLSASWLDPCMGCKAYVLQEQQQDSWPDALAVVVQLWWSVEVYSVAAQQHYSGCAATFNRPCSMNVMRCAYECAFGLVRLGSPVLDSNSPQGSC